jgi:hypothetical protein
MPAGRVASADLPRGAPHQLPEYDVMSILG